MQTVKDTARRLKISTQAVYKQLKTYKSELNGHVFKQNGRLMLDDFAIEFLETKRSVNPVIIEKEDSDERIKLLERENKELLLNIAALQKKLLEQQDRIIFQQEQILLMERERNALEEKKPEKLTLKKWIKKIFKPE